METIKKFFNDECIVIGLCQLKNSDSMKKRLFQHNSMQEREYYLNTLFNNSYAKNILLG